MWNFRAANNSPDKKIYYGQAINIRCITDMGGYICACPSFTNPGESSEKCENNMGIYTYNNKANVKKYGEWIIMPKFNSLYNIDTKKYEIFVNKCFDNDTTNNDPSIKRTRELSDKCNTLSPSPFGRSIYTEYKLYNKSKEEQVPINSTNSDTQIKTHFDSVDKYIGCHVNKENYDYKINFKNINNPEGEGIDIIIPTKIEEDNKKRCHVYLPEGCRNSHYCNLRTPNEGKYWFEDHISGGNKDVETCTGKEKRPYIWNQWCSPLDTFKQQNSRHNFALLKQEDGSTEYVISNKRYYYKEIVEEIMNVGDILVGNNDKYLIVIKNNITLDDQFKKLLKKYGYSPSKLERNDSITKDDIYMVWCFINGLEKKSVCISSKKRECKFINDKGVEIIKPGKSNKEYLELILDKIKMSNTLKHKTDLLSMDNSVLEDDISENDIITNIFNKKIPIRIGKERIDTPAPTTPAPTTATTPSPKLDSGDVFYIINKNKFGGKYLFLSNCVNSEEYQLKCDVITDDSKENKTFNLPVGILSSTTDFEYEKDISKYVAWNVSKINYNINIDGTLYVKDRLQVGESIITADTIRKIKKLPYLFKDEICLKNSKGIKSCMGPEHIEILRGERNLTIQTFIRLRPFTLYSKPNFKGRELKIGFDYKNSRNLPFIQFDSDGNINPDGSWKSIKVEASYSIILYDSPLELETELNSCHTIEACKNLNKTKCKEDCESNDLCNYIQNTKDSEGIGKCELEKPGEIIATLYAYPNQNQNKTEEGWKIAIDRLGTYTKTDLVKETEDDTLKYKDNEISDIVIQTGYKITLYENDDLKGRSQTFYKGSPKDGIGFLAEKMSSLKVEKDYTIKKKLVSENISNISDTATKGTNELNWAWGIRAVSFPYDFTSKNGETVKITSNPIKKQCLTKTSKKIIGKVEDIYTAGSCINTINQKFKIKPHKTTQSGVTTQTDTNSYSDYSSDHLHFHRHKLGTIHDNTDYNQIHNPTDPS